MKNKFVWGIILLASLIFGSCGSKVSKEELDKKIENMDPDKVTFSDEEYEFMTNYLIKHADDKSDDNEELTEEEAQQFVYFILLNEADEKGKLKGKTKKQFETLAKKVQSSVKEAQEEAMQSVEQALRAAEEEEDDDYSYDDMEGDPPIGY